MSSIDVVNIIQISCIMMREAFDPILRVDDFAYHGESVDVFFKTKPPKDNWHGGISSALYLWNDTLRLDIRVNIDALGSVFRYDSRWVLHWSFGFESSIVDLNPSAISFTKPFDMLIVLLLFLDVSFLL